MDHETDESQQLGMEALVSAPSIFFIDDADEQWPEEERIATALHEGIDDIDAWAYRALSASGFGAAALDYE